MLDGASFHTVSHQGILQAVGVPQALAGTTTSPPGFPALNLRTFRCLRLVSPVISQATGNTGGWRAALWVGIVNLKENMQDVATLHIPSCPSYGRPAALAWAFHGLTCSPLLLCQLT